MSRYDPGVYRILNSVTGKMYVGGTVHLQRRWNCHLHYLRKNKYQNEKLQRSFDKHGESAFAFEILERCGLDLVLSREQFYLDELKPHENGYNISGLAYLIRLGSKLSEESKKKISQNRKGKGRNHGRPMSDETKQKLSDSLTGRKIHTPESKAKMSKAGIGRFRSAESRLKCSRSQIGRTLPLEQRVLISKSLTGKVQSDQTCQKRRASLLRFWQNKKSNVFAE